MSDAFVAEIRFFAGNFAPTGWAFCQGQLLPIRQNSALFSLLGNTYGGDGSTTFALPDLRGRSPMHPGQGRGLTPRRLGETGGTEAVTLLKEQMPPHSHTLQSAATPNSPVPTLSSYFAPTSNDKPIYGPATHLTDMAAGTLGPFGGGNPAHNNRQPYLALNFIIALQGVFPQRV